MRAPWLVVVERPRPCSSCVWLCSAWRPEEIGGDVTATEYWMHNVLVSHYSSELLGEAHSRRSRALLTDDVLCHVE